MAMSIPKNTSSGSKLSLGPIGGMIPGMKQASQASQLLSDPKGTAKNMAQQMAKEVVKKIAKQVAKKIATAILTNPYVLAAIGIGIAIIVFFLIIIAVVTGQGGSSTNSAGGGGLIPTPTAAPGPAPVNNTILSWGQQISSYLQTYPTSCSGFYIYNVMLQPVSNGSYTARQKPGSECGTAGSSYYCTNLVIDSYNLAGIKNNFSQYVPTMIGQWESVAGLAVQRSSNVNRLQPGDAIFWLISNAASSAQHTDIIQSIDVSASTGNGTLTTIDANTNSKVNKFYVRDWNLIGKWITGNVAWFGLGPR